jgi:hypothetical protein
VFENRVLRRIFGSERGEVPRGWRRPHNDENYNLYASPYIIIRMIKSRRLRWAGHILRMGEARNAYNILLENLKGRDHLEDLGVYGKIILEWILRKQGGKVGTTCSLSSGWLL